MSIFVTRDAWRHMSARSDSVTWKSQSVFWFHYGFLFSQKPIKNGVVSNISRSHFSASELQRSGYEWRRVRESNPGHIGDKRAPSLRRYACTPGEQNPLILYGKNSLGTKAHFMFSMTTTTEKLEPWTCAWSGRASWLEMRQQPHNFSKKKTSTHNHQQIRGEAPSGSLFPFACFLSSALKTNKMQGAAKKCN